MAWNNPGSEDVRVRRVQILGTLLRIIFEANDGHCVVRADILRERNKMNE